MNLTVVNLNLTGVRFDLTGVRFDLTRVRFDLTAERLRLTAVNFNLTGVRFHSISEMYPGLKSGAMRLRPQGALPPGLPDEMCGTGTPAARP